jgi:hypothetical protein
MQSTSKHSYLFTSAYGIAMWFFAIQSTTCQAQSQIELEKLRQNRIGIENKILGEAVQRTSDIRAVATTTSDLSDRISRLERMLLSARPYAGISVKEARAAFNLAMAERNELRKRPTKPSEVEIAAAELSVARAESQLTITLATQREELLLCQLDVIEAELALLQISKNVELQERLIARGIKTSEIFMQQKLALSAAEKRLELMRVRYETQRVLQGISTKEPAPQSKPSSDSSVTP